ncbi:hypothetical protein MGAST_00505 [Mycobacterium gastri 'Wayne']|nr:hypothetical protein MGAST_00505 [Mycobacterium gastri 'Wayne']
MASARIVDAQSLKAADTVSRVTRGFDLSWLTIGDWRWPQWVDLLFCGFG